ncbi:MAG: hypothetical protein AAFW46_15250 [Pseudomonadota bacterium]
MNTGRALWRRRDLLAAGLAAAALPPGGPAVGHPDDEYVFPTLFVWRTRRSPDGTEVEVDLEIFNGFGVAATLRSVTASVGEATTLERKRSLLGFEAWQPVGFLRLEPGKTIVLSPPEYRMTIHGIDAPEEETVSFEIEADFGPLGKLYTRSLAIGVEPGN